MPAPANWVRTDWSVSVAGVVVANGATIGSADVSAAAQTALQAQYPGGVISVTTTKIKPFANAADVPV